MTFTRHGCGIIGVIDRYKPQSVKGANLFNKLRSLNVITPQTGKILNYNAIYQLCLDCLHHTVKLRTQEICAGIAVINEDGNLVQSGMIGNILIQKCCLVLNGIGAFSVVLYGQSDIEGGFPNADGGINLSLYRVLLFA